MDDTSQSGVLNVLKFFLLVLLFLPLAFCIAKRNHGTIEAFEASGEVVEIDWNSRDHGMPIITIRQGNKFKLFKSNRITLGSKDIKVGDYFNKVAASKKCKVNEELINCIN